MFGYGTLERLNELLPKRSNDNDHLLFLIDNIHHETGLMDRIELGDTDKIFWVDTSYEPTTWQIDNMRDQISDQQERNPVAVIAVGGGSTMDVGKSISILLTNGGKSADFQGWDLVKTPALYKVGIPTLAGTGAEASRTAVLTGPDKKLGINSDQSIFDAILCDASLLESVPYDQRFFTAMDCYIHCVESLQGLMINEMSKSYASKALDLCRKVIREDADDEKLMVASYLGGCSIANSEVGICHALSYGLSLVLGFRHGIANCIAFNVLEKYYGVFVNEMREMMALHGIVLPEHVTNSLDGDDLEKMVNMTLKMEKPLTNTLGQGWREKLTVEEIVRLYTNM